MLHQLQQELICCYSRNAKSEMAKRQVDTCIAICSLCNVLPVGKLKNAETETAKMRIGGELACLYVAHSLWPHCASTVGRNFPQSVLAQVGAFDRG